ncbi:MULTISPECIES: DUF4406 domain-containing protein [Alicyclobacillus]|uniref:DUF4406 domain-containing protein n=1 Tax=Alicyclobacillus acidoterrestris (strain ATCC 49025 / DSM 3922 / CIP 106132 / NCIMB 13137 / GD3B) TaxID=1356854 RepID=T0DP30_ALIAG|nr:MULTISPECIES: DUF4406 domain-containing protein [Alicyclobacillus]EPZ53127.1 hypothetical protein N007_18045 [Alicyclobacillus acidoterrestris ATCC 49025]UNO49178.1 DUF4406 domain-containing protein [Alicyclobacillus acidoterrestris]
MTHIYLSGPMTGHPDFNRPAFNNAAYCLRITGYQVTNPAEQHIPGASWADYLRHDLALMLQADCVVTLTGWQQSKGASLEVYVAKQLGIPVYELTEVLGTEGKPARDIGEGIKQLSLGI